ncbi:beta-lactamase-like protein [Pseudomassariella vexata]|uniref:ribonuclease Z n=1 Tax=Pseudomassariella vexata TaxID=1141098 RepID=A0A1Y2EEL5_9PEZI|nr:beta-lactamase-like protein [Pseudomassariella vexata]ORY70023.1 beta-lactamase-like protein [Pseudomassariella vexata]
MLNWVQLVTTPTDDTPGTCLLLHYDDQRYIFGGLAEGTQRAMVQRKIGLNRAEEMFLTGIVNWRNAGGLMGMILTLADIVSSQKEATKTLNEERKQKGRKAIQDVAISKLSIHGGKNLSHFLATARRFIFRKGLPLLPHEVREDPRTGTKGSNEPDFKDHNIKVWYMPVESAAESTTPIQRKRSHDEISGPNGQNDHDTEVVERIVTQMFDSNWNMDALIETTLHQVQLPAKVFVRGDNGHIQVYEGLLPGEADDVPDIPVLVREPWPAAKVQSLPRTEPSRQSMCYIVKNHDRRGKFKPEAAQALNVAKRDYSKLTKGASITTEDGRTVTPEMVLEDNVIGKGFAIVDVPDDSFVEPLVSRTEWSNNDIMEGITVIFWTLGPGVVKDSRIQDFMKTHETLRHIVCSEDTSPNMIALESVATQAWKLRGLDRDRFPVPSYNNALSLSGESTTCVSDLYEVGRTGKMIQFSPNYLHQDDKIVPFPDLPKLATTESDPRVWLKAQKLSQHARDQIEEAAQWIDDVTSDIPNRDAEIITLGTGSALPSKYRNVSATLVKIPGVGNYLFDAGENTLGQMRRTLNNEFPEVVRNLKAIWISHLHADHHLGTAGVIKAWHEETSKTNPSARLHVASHQHMIDWLREYADVEDFGFDRLAYTSFRNWDRSDRLKIAEPKIFSREETARCGLERIDACFVQHCNGAMATVFTWPSGLKIAYSGDCRPSDGFVQIGQGATVLIHESTFDDELKGDAIAKKHSTMSEAIGIGRRMGARNILLTHFSQRYQQIPIIEEDTADKEEAKKQAVTLVAFDYMRIKIGEFRKARAFLPAIQKLFEDSNTVN